MSLFGRIVDLSSVDMHPYALALREAAIARKGSAEEQDRAFPLYDWQRLSYVYGLLRPGSTCLEVGPGRGFLSKMLVQGKRYERLNAIDITQRNAIPKSVEFEIMSVADLRFEDRSFDTVLCMEVLEHLDDGLFSAALAHIRRVCRGQLIVTVPFMEPQPLPAYHKQHFDERRIRSLFPNALTSLLLKNPIVRVPWMLVEEDHG